MVQESLTVIQIVIFFFFSDINYKMTISQVRLKVQLSETHVDLFS